MRLFVVSLCVVTAAVAGCQVPCAKNLPPAPMLAGPGPGVTGPGPGVVAPVYQPPHMGPAPTSQLAFVGPEGMSIQWDVSAPGAFDSQPLITPARYNFPQMAIYRLKLTNIPGRPGIELYPTIEVGPTLPRSEAFLAHNSIPVQLTEEDFDQVQSGNFVTKVIYLPDPQFQQLALSGVDTLVSTRLDPGVDPVVEADRRGAILAIVRLGNKDMQIPNSDPTQVNAMGGPGAGCPLGMPVGNATMGSAPPAYLAGVTAPQYGMPSSGTPIGLAGPPYVPHGIPAGLQKHTIVNHTQVHMPPPTEDVRIDVRQQQGYSYPAPVNRIAITEGSTPGLSLPFQAGHPKKACATQQVPCTVVDDQAVDGTEAGSAGAVGSPAPTPASPVPTPIME